MKISTPSIIDYSDRVARFLDTGKAEALVGQHDPMVDPATGNPFIADRAGAPADPEVGQDNGPSHGNAGEGLQNGGIFGGISIGFDDEGNFTFGAFGGEHSEGGPAGGIGWFKPFADDPAPGGTPITPAPDPAAPPASEPDKETEKKSDTKKNMTPGRENTGIPLSEAEQKLKDRLWGDEMKKIESGPNRDPFSNPNPLAEDRPAGEPKKRDDQRAKNPADPYHSATRDDPRGAKLMSMSGVDPRTSNPNPLTEDRPSEPPPAGKIPRRPIIG